MPTLHYDSLPAPKEIICNRCGNRTIHDCKGEHYRDLDFDRESHLMERLGYRLWICRGCERGTMEIYTSVPFFDDIGPEDYVPEGGDPESVYEYEYISEQIETIPPAPGIPTEVIRISRQFAEIYKQAHSAEHYGLDQIAGVGYRKALEFLVKDYCIRVSGGKKSEIKEATLATCIKNFVEDGQVRLTAERAAWLGNDETHYVRRWRDKDINDLKKLIALTMNWIGASVRTRKYVNAMPRSAGGKSSSRSGTPPLPMV